MGGLLRWLWLLYLRLLLLWHSKVSSEIWFELVVLIVMVPTIEAYVGILGVHILPHILHIFSFLLQMAHPLGHFLLRHIIVIFVIAEFEMLTVVVAVGLVVWPIVRRGDRLGLQATGVLLVRRVLEHFGANIVKHAA